MIWRAAGRRITSTVPGQDLSSRRENGAYMKRLLFIILLSAILPLHIAQASVENAEIYNSANDLYSKKEYHEALDLYLELANRGIQNPLLYYNVANTYFKTGNIGHAVLYFERALLLKPLDRDIRANLDHVRSQLEDKIAPLYEEGVLKLLRKVFSFPNIKIFVYLEIVLFSTLIIILLFFLFLSHSRTRLKNPIIVIGVVYLAVLIGLISQFAYEKKFPQGIILRKELDVKSSPLVESETLFTLHEGTKFRLIESRGEWIRFSIQDGRQGWILQESVAFIQEG
jgi:tetratricopeptide (TPR) repeat protein